eukprot:1162859-Rhodomonas_salina.1
MGVWHGPVMWTVSRTQDWKKERNSLLSRYPLLPLAPTSCHKQPAPHPARSRHSEARQQLNRRRHTKR